MRSIVISGNIQNRVFLPYCSITYPKDRQAFFNGNYFGGCGITTSVHYRSCEQLFSGKQLTDLQYYHWTLEKLSKYGETYENFLFSDTKGCGIETQKKEAFRLLSKNERQHALAHAATMSFYNLYVSIMNDWEPSRMSREITFYKLFNNRFTIHEGRHRIAILMFKYNGTAGYDTFETEKSNVRNGYYRSLAYGMLHKGIKKLIGRK